MTKEQAHAEICILAEAIDTRRPDLVMPRLSEAFLEQCRLEINSVGAGPVLLLLALTLTGAAKGVDTTLDQIKMNLREATALVMIEDMRRAGQIEVQYPPVLGPEVGVKITEKGRARQQELERKYGLEKEKP